MKTAKVPSLLLAFVLQVFPVTRLFVAATPVTGSSFAIVSTWIAGLAALMGAHDAVSGASTTITSSGTATGTNGTAFSYRITTGPDGANTFSAVPLPTGLTCNRTSGRITGTPGESGVFSVLLTASDGGRASRTVTKTLTLTVLNGGGGTSAPSIITQPSNSTATNGGVATFSVVASGSGTLRYQWLANSVPVPGATNATWTRFSVTTNDAGTCSVVVTNDHGAITSSIVTLTVLVPPSISSHPAGIALLAGGSAEFSVVAAGSAPLGYRWRKNSSYISGANSATYTIPATVAGDSGSYTVVVTNGAGSITSLVATLTVTNLPALDVIAPIVAIAAPAAAVTLVTSNTFNLTGTASDNEAVAAVWIRQNEVEQSAATGTTSWSATATLAAGTNSFRIWVTDVAGNSSVTNTRMLVYKVSLPLALTVNGDGIVTGATNGQVIELGRTLTLKATPKSGNVFSNWVVNGEASVGSTLAVTMSSNLNVVANFVPNPFAALKGVYTGLFYPAGAEPPHEQSGSFTFSITDKGAYSGKLFLAGASYSASGTLDLSLSTTKTIARRGTTDLVLGFQLQSGSDAISGSVSNVAWASDLGGYRAGFHAKLNPATNEAGKYTILFTGGDDSALSPAGDSPATMAVSTAGAVALKGVLADGTTFAQKATLAANGQVPVYVNLYKGRGSLLGWLTVLDNATNDTPGLLLWTKKETAGGKLYLSGFTNEALALGSRYVAPPKGSGALGWSDGVATLAQGNLTVTQTDTIALSAANKFLVAAPNANRLALTLKTASGLVSGSFVHPDTQKKSAIKGIILQKQQIGGGFFLGTNQSGRVTIEE